MSGRILLVHGRIDKLHDLSPALVVVGRRSKRRVVRVQYIRVEISAGRLLGLPLGERVRMRCRLYSDKNKQKPCNRFMESRHKQCVSWIHDMYDVSAGVLQAGKGA